MATEYETQCTSPEEVQKFWQVVSDNMVTIRRAYFWLLRRWPPKYDMDVEDRLNHVIYELYRLDKVHKYDPATNRDLGKYLFQEVEYIMSHEYNRERMVGNRESAVETTGTRYEPRVETQFYSDVDTKFRDLLSAREKEWLDCILGGENSADLARRRNVSRTAIGKIKKSVTAKYTAYISGLEAEARGVRAAFI